MRWKSFSMDCRHGNESCSRVVLVYILIFGFRNTFSYSFPILQFSLELLTLQNPLLIGIQLQLSVKKNCLLFQYYGFRFLNVYLQFPAQQKKNRCILVNQKQIILKGIQLKLQLTKESALGANIIKPPNKVFGGAGQHNSIVEKVVDSYQ